VPNVILVWFDMRILVFNWRCWLNPFGGGAERFTYEVFSRLVRRGCSVTWFTSRFPGCLDEEVVDGVRLIRAGGRFTVYSEARKYYIKYFKDGFDIIIDEINTKPFMTVDFVRDTPIAALIHQLAREFWSYEMFFPLSVIGRYFLEDRWLRKYCSIPTITVSESTKCDLEDLGFREIYVVSEGLNIKPLGELPEKEEKPTIIFLGRLKRVKQPEHALKAFKHVKEEIPDARLWIIGDGPLRKRLERRAFNGVRFFGRVSEEEKINLLRRAHVLVFPGVREGWGLTVIEAASQGTPTVAYDVPGLRDSVRHMETGLLTPANDVERLAENLIKILRNSELRIAFSKRALAYSRLFNWDNTADQVFNILKSVSDSSDG